MDKQTDRLTNKQVPKDSPTHIQTDTSVVGTVSDQTPVYEQSCQMIEFQLRSYTAPKQLTLVLVCWVRSCGATRTIWTSAYFHFAPISNVLSKRFILYGNLKLSCGKPQEYSG